MELISSGAEALIYKDKLSVGGTEYDVIVKDRIKKNYRIVELDESLRFSRTRFEKRILKKLSKIILVPRLFSSTDSKLVMEYISGVPLRDVLDKNNFDYYGKIISAYLTKMHDNNIIHGDLTTSNMLVVKDNLEVNVEVDIYNLFGDVSLKENGYLYFIDFGLSFVSQRVEDKAVDLHLLKRALESKHYDIFDELFKVILDNYMPKNKSEIMKRFEKVESRGRNKNK